MRDQRFSSGSKLLRSLSQIMPAVNYRRVFSPKVVNELTVGYSRFRFFLLQSQAGIDPPPFGQECLR